MRLLSLHGIENENELKDRYCHTVTIVCEAINVMQIILI